MNKRIIFWIMNIFFAVMLTLTLYVRFVLDRFDIAKIIAFSMVAVAIGYLFIMLTDRGYFEKHRNKIWFQYIFVPKKLRKERDNIFQICKINFWRRIESCKEVKNNE